jgi:hypothetical protein
MAWRVGYRNNLTGAPRTNCSAANANRYRTESRYPRSVRPVLFIVNRCGHQLLMNAASSTGRCNTI